MISSIGRSDRQNWGSALILNEGAAGEIVGVTSHHQDFAAAMAFGGVRELIDETEERSISDGDSAASRNSGQPAWLFIMAPDASPAILRKYRVPKEYWSAIVLEEDRLAQEKKRR